jgi:sugar/nucleoside kinase (ribokinase family)
MADILIMGESLVEIMRDHEDVQLYKQGYFRGPFPSGAPAICASAAARLGAKVILISGVGNDDFGKCILDRLNEVNVDTSHMAISKTVSTGCAFVTYFSDGSRKFIFHMGNSAAVEGKAPSADVVKGLKYMHIMGCSLAAKKEFAYEILKTMHMAVDAGALISFDPNIRKELLTDDSINEILNDVLQNTSIFLPGKEELLQIMGTETIEEAIKKCFSYPKMQMIVLKNGSKGSTLYQRNNEPMHGESYKIIQQDATGAGDCFDGAFLAALTQKKTVTEALKWAAAAGALNAAAFGPMEGDIRPETVAQMIEGHKNE